MPNQKKDWAFFWIYLKFVYNNQYMTELNKKIISAFAGTIGFVLRRRRRFLFVCLLIVFAVIVYLRQVGYLNSEKIFFSINEFPTLAPFLFILIHALMIIFLIPTLPMNLGAGFLWGTLLGGTISLAAASTGAAFSFLISRYLIHDYINSRFNNSYWLWLREEIQKRNWKIVAFTRANPAFPFGLTSYFFGLTPLSFGNFFVSTVIFIIPASFLFAYVGHSIGGIVLGGENGNLMENIIVISLVATVVFLISVAAKKYFEIKKRRQDGVSDHSAKI